jgi:YidC/Oxa1 family membrane protein insertase
MMLVYKENNINPLSGCLYGFIQIPLFFAFYESLHRLPIMFEGSLLGYSLSMSPWKGMTSGNWLYAVLPVLVFVATFFSFKLNSGAGMSGAQEKQMKMMMNIMMVMIFFMSFTMSTGIIFYWITNNTFTIVQNLIVKRSK